MTGRAVADVPMATRAAGRHWLARRWGRNPKALLGACLVLAFIVLAVGAPVIAPYDPARAQLARESILRGPSATHWLGTDHLGRDLFSRIVYGSRISLQISVIAVSIAVGLGVPFGVLAGFAGGRLDTLMMRLMDALMAFPSLILLMAMAAAVGPSLVTSTIAIGIVFAPGYARLARGQVLSLKTEAFVEAAVATGASSVRIMARHILPNLVAPVTVLASLSSASVILIEASLSFIGLGVQPPDPAWGSMLFQGYQYIRSTPWPSLGPGIAIVLLVLGFNFFGDSLRDVLDPRLRGMSR